MKKTIIIYLSVVLLIVISVVAFWTIRGKNKKVIKFENVSDISNVSAGANDEANEMEERYKQEELNSVDQIDIAQKKVEDEVAIKKETTKTEIKKEAEKEEGKETPENFSGNPSVRLVNFGFKTASGRKIDTIIIHSSYNPNGGDQYSADSVINIYKQYGVAAHYLIDRKGNIIQLVAEKNIAYHAGVSKVPDGREDVNNFSIGIELLNTTEDKYTDAQYSAVNNLVANLKKKYSIKYVLGHKDISPGRKTDPWNFDFGKLK